MNARQIIRERQIFADGTIEEVVVWLLPDPVPGSNHHFKYRLFFGMPGKRLIGYDNERGKGDHRHIEEVEEPYIFTGPRQLLVDFYGEIARWRANRADDDDTHRAG